jgi:hypothetical protein
MQRSFSKFQRPMASAALKIARRAAFSAPHSSSRHCIGHPMAFALRKASASRSGQAAAEKRDVVSAGLQSARALCTPAATASDDTQLLDAYSRAITSVVVSAVYKTRFLIIPLLPPPSVFPLFPPLLRTPTLKSLPLSRERSGQQSYPLGSQRSEEKARGLVSSSRPMAISSQTRVCQSPPSSFPSPPRHIPPPPHQHKNVAPSALPMPCHATKPENFGNSCRCGWIGAKRAGHAHRRPSPVC